MRHNAAAEGILCLGFGPQLQRMVALPNLLPATDMATWKSSGPDQHRQKVPTQKRDLGLGMFRLIQRVRSGDYNRGWHKGEHPNLGLGPLETLSSSMQQGPPEASPSDSLRGAQDLQHHEDGCVDQRREGDQPGCVRNPITSC